MNTKMLISIQMMFCMLYICIYTYILYKQIIIIKNRKKKIYITHLIYYVYIYI